MGRRRWAALALVTAVIAVAGACTPPASPNAPLLVTTTADTFDGVCDTDCSLRDAVAAANALPQVNGAPNRITLPTGTIVLSGATPLTVTRGLDITGAGVGLTTLDITGTAIAGGAGVFDVRVPTSLNKLDVVSTNTPAADILASCTNAGPRPFRMVTATTTGLAATSSGCDTTLISTIVTGPTTVIAPNRFAATSSTLPFADTTLTPLSFAAIGSNLTGPSSSDGSTAPSTLDLQPPNDLANLVVTLTGSKVVGLDLRLGGDQPGVVTTTALSTSFALNGTGGPTSITVGAGTTAKFVNSSVHGGGAGGALFVDGTLNLESATITTAGPAIIEGPSGVVNTRRSILGTTAGAVCNTPVNSLGFNVVVGATCGTPAATDVTVANEAALLLGPVSTFGTAIISQHRAPDATSPAVDLIPPGPVSSPDCPTEAGQGRSLDAIGTFRPVGTGCDAGAIEFEPPEPPVGG